MVKIYNSTDGENWTNNTNWLSSEPISEWYGVTVGNNTSTRGNLVYTTSLVSLNLSNNNLSGQIPVEIGDMIDMKTLKLGNNHLSGSVPTEINNIISLQTLEISKNKLDELSPLTLSLLDTLLIDNNQFSFEDIVPNLNVPIKGFIYHSQDSIGINKDTICNVGSSIKFVASDSAENNIYQWYKNSVSISKATNNSYLKSNLQQSDGGSYTCTITNSSVPGLTIYQRPVKLQVSTMTSVDELNNPGMKVYPNPTNGIIYIEMNKSISSNSKIEVRDLYGRIFLQKNWEDDNRNQLDLTPLSKGMYFILIRNNNKICFHKIVIQ